MRFLYCACVVSSLLNDWSGFDVEAATRYVVSSQSYDGAFGMAPGLEGHGGSTYCAVAALALMGRLDRIRDRRALLRWCVRSQGRGYMGRPHKDPDSCYSFWIGAAIAILGEYNVTATEGNIEFNLQCQFPAIGGLAKHPEHFPDVLHSYMGIAGLALAGVEGLSPLDPALGITRRAAEAEASTHTSDAASATATTVSASTPGPGPGPAPITGHSSTSGLPSPSPPVS